MKGRMGGGGETGGLTRKGGFLMLGDDFRRIFEYVQMLYVFSKLNTHTHTHTIYFELKNFFNP